MSNRDPVVGPREHLLDLLKQRVEAHAEVRRADRRVERARQRAEAIAAEAQEHWTAVRVLDSLIAEAASGLWPQELGDG
jgi:hypothetical protein